MKTEKELKEKWTEEIFNLKDSDKIQNKEDFKKGIAEGVDWMYDIILLMNGKHPIQRHFTKLVD
jgi:hypothetical protein